jgi:hypothetical protein
MLSRAGSYVRQPPRLKLLDHRLTIAADCVDLYYCNRFHARLLDMCSIQTPLGFPFASLASGCSVPGMTLTLQKGA